MLTAEERHELKRKTRQGETLHQWVLRIMAKLQEMDKNDLSTTLFNIVKEAYMAGAASNVKGRKRKSEIEGDYIKLIKDVEMPKQVTSEERLAVYIRNTPLMPRTENALRQAGIKTIGDLVQRSGGELMRLRGFGHAALFDTEEMLRHYGLQLKKTIHKDVL